MVSPFAVIWRVRPSFATRRTVRGLLTVELRNGVFEAMRRPGGSGELAAAAIAPDVHDLSTRPFNI
jgi:hypothetical protein